MRGPSYGGGKSTDEFVQPVYSGSVASSGGMTEAQTSKLAGIATGATANDTDANLKARANHTGTQAISTVTGLQTAIDGKAASSHSHVIADVTGLQTALDAKAASASVPNASYRVILDSTGSHIAARTANTYGLGQGQPAAITGVGTLYALNTIYIAAADYPSVNGLATKLRVRAVMAVNDVAPTGNYTFGLHPVTRPATSGGAGLCIYTIGAAVSGSTVALNTPAADSLNNVAGADFAIPADGFYVLGFVSTGTVATSSHSHISMSLQMRNN